MRINDPFPVNPDQIPVNLAVQAYNGCNCRCLMCAYKETHIHEKHEGMAFELFCKIIDELIDAGSLASVALSLQCEALLDKGLFQKIAYVKKQSATITCALSTNALLLTPDMLTKLTDCGLDHIGVSLNAVSTETFETVYGVPGFDVYSTHVQHLLENRPAHMSISFNAMLIKENIKELLPKKQKLFTAISEHGIPLTMGPIGNHCGSLSEYEKHVVLPHLQGSTRKGYCHDIFESVYILYNGDVIGCCSDFRRKHVLGSVKKDTVIDIWNSDRYAQRRQEMLHADLSGLDPCCQCSQARNIMQNRGDDE